MKSLKLAAKLLTVVALCPLSSASADVIPMHIEPQLYYHEGGTDINLATVFADVNNIVMSLPRASRVEHMTDLVYETLVVETFVGKLSYDYAAENYNNYGIAQIREDTAEWFMNMLFKRDREAFSAIYQYYNSDHTLVHNLMTNVSFSIALCAELYAYRMHGLKADTVQQRAKLWKKLYNTAGGAGTVKIYVDKVTAHYSRNSFNMVSL